MRVAIFVLFCEIIQSLFLLLLKNKNSDVANKKKHKSVKIDEKRISYGRYTEKGVNTSLIFRKQSAKACPQIYQMVQNHVCLLQPLDVSKKMLQNSFQTRSLIFLVLLKKLVLLKSFAKFVISM